MSFFTYRVKPENRCEGLRKFPPEHVFTGAVQWSKYYNEFYLTTDGITYTSTKDAYDVGYAVHS